ncbi:hypothetical protein PCCS19_13240 [Paenibacillus sp. CCS19]|uniref:hypothetical protein n=1 Tax=Paenibacillus sp. CCS19 TaxID=3158387 RepID=UPI002560148B|nr:hypothetical protein [Paenibacillus cellulosilyticus]GMK38270.1 hypothetical protein PCCS19_13240 [Paenibacillus cellulosilyticus]
MTLSNAYSPVESLLKELLVVTNTIAELDLKEVANDSLLLSFRIRQVELRDSISHAIQGTMLTETDKIIVAQCLEIEYTIMNKMLSIQEENRSHLRMLNNGKLTRNAYQYERASNMGYFIDQHQ